MAAMQDRLWDDYEAHHRAEGNKVCHMLGIPLIIGGLLGLLAIPLAQVGGVPVEGSLLLLLIAGGIYLWLDIRLGLVMIAFSALIYLGARMLPWPASLGLFLGGWVFQLIGHGVYEKRSPAFMGNLAHLLVGPLWVLNYLIPLHRSQTLDVSGKPEVNR
ncbi:MAG TPA: Mpo1-like protein [Terriglobia bacterium]|nr:Mpo1-like protein [Terriglobia bacterium]